MLELAITSLYLGSIHILTAPDHLAALIPLSLTNRKLGWRIGLLWGLGHLIGLIALGLVLFFFKSLINLESLERFGTVYIGLILIILGLWIYLRSNKISLEISSEKQYQTKKITIGTGFIQGIAGFSHIYTLAPAISMDNNKFFAYFGGFSLGSMISVVLFTYLLCFVPKIFTPKEKTYRKICRISAVIAFALGVMFIVMFLSDKHVH